MYSENGKKSIYFDNKLDIIILISVFILIISPVIISSIFRLSVKSRQKDIYLSARCEEFFGLDTMKTLAPEFEKQNPDLRIRLLSAPIEKTGEKGAEPDILFFYESELNTLAAEGALLDEAGGQIQAEPLVAFMDLLFYNIELLRAAGFERPPKTREEFLVYAKTISAANDGILADAAGTVTSLNGQPLSREVFSWIWAGGGNFWPNEDSAPVINTRQMINDLNFLGSLYQDGTQDQELSPMSEEQVLDSFANGKIAMIIASTSGIGTLRERMGDDAFGITTIPGAGTAGKYSIGLTGIFAGINKNSAYPDAAQVFLDYLKAKSPLLCEQLKAVPGYTADLRPEDNKNYIKEDPFYSKAWDIFEASAIVRGFLGIPGAQEYENALREETQGFFEGKRTAQETVVAIQKRWDEIYADPVPQE